MNMALEVDGYENFKRTAGLIYNNYYYEFGKLEPNYGQKLKEFWDLLYQRLPGVLLDQFEEPEEGNPLSIDYKGRKVSFDLGMSIYEYYTISKHIDFSKIRLIDEIGSGYGRTAFVISKLHPEIKYRIYDFEPSLSLAKRYLTSVLPNGDFEFSTPDKLEGKCGLFLAIDCLHEMTREQVSEYFDYADKHASFFYYSCLRNIGVPLEGITWDQRDYPDKENWQTLFYKPHFLKPDFFEKMLKI